MAAVLTTSQLPWVLAIWAARAPVGVTSLVPSAQCATPSPSNVSASLASEDFGAKGQYCSKKIELQPVSTWTCIYLRLQLYVNVHADNTSVFYGYVSC